MSVRQDRPGEVGRRASASDVARLAGVSQSAVSRALADLPGVSARTRARIRTIADELDYRPNALARGLITQRSGIIGLVVSDLGNPFLNDVLARSLGLLRQENLQAMLFAADSGEAAGMVVDDLGRYRVDGSLVISPHLPEAVGRRFARLGPTVVMFNRLLPGLEHASSVSVDNRAAGAMVADHLIAMGHRRLGYLHGIAGAATDEDRFDGFRSRLAEAGLDAPRESRGDYGYEGGAAAVGELLSQGTGLSALFCANDAMAMGAIDAARYRFGKSIPDDLAVVGFDDVPPASWPGYALTTVRQPVDTILRLGLDLLREGGEAGPRSIVLPPELVRRGSA